MAILFSRRRATLFVSTALLLLLSILTVTLYSSTLAFISNPLADLSRRINFDQQSYPPLLVLPQNLDIASSKLVLASSIISLVVSSACVIFALLFWPDGNRVSSSEIYDLRCICLLFEFQYIVTRIHLNTHCFRFATES
jgi:hypothetical protein